MRYNITFILITLISFKSFSQSNNLENIIINENIPLTFKYDVNEPLFQIDSITPVSPLMDMADFDSIIYYGKSSFSLYNDSVHCELISINFDEKITKIKLNRTTIDPNTTYTDLKNEFKNSCSELSPLEIYHDNRELYSCMVKIKNSDNQLLFIYHKDKLVRIDNWYP